jgi:hypothetical protein
MITAAAEIISHSPQRQSSEPTTPQKMQIQHPKKLKLKTKDDPDSMPSSPLRTMGSSSSSYNNNSNNLLNDDQYKNRPYFMTTTPFNSSSRSASVNSNSLNNSNNQNSEENKAKIHEILQMGIARAQQQRADEIKIVTCNCKKSKCLKM